MILHSNRLRSFLLASALLGIAVAASPVAHAATVVIINNNNAGEGFNDPTAAAPVGGNTGTTIGQQRLIAFQAAANIWAARLSSSVPIRVGAQFNPLTCTNSTAILGSAGPTESFRDFSGAPVASTWYAVALANALHGSDLDAASDDISATFSSNIGTPGCLSSSGWYYGLDGNIPANRIDFVSVLIHELGHGLGFLTFVDLTTGAKMSGFDDTFMLNLEDHGASPSDYPTMSNAQRVAASIDTGNLHWTGANVRAVSGLLTAGNVGDHVRMYAPNPAESGSSVSHWDTVLTPNQVMEPNYTGALHNPILELPLFKDIGWTVWAKPHDFNGNLKSDVLWRHTSGYVSMWLMNGATVSANLGVGGADTSWTIIGTASNTSMGSNIPGTGDFNGDGKTDILWQHTSGYLSMFLMNGATVSSNLGVGGIDPSWTIVGTGDFNGDGKSDILLRHSSGYVSMFLMNGATVTSNLGVGGSDTAWTIVGIGDFNGDGKSDILWRHSSGYLAMWLMDGATVISNIGVGGSDTAWTVVGTGDFNGDGKADILMRHSSGYLSMLLMNGATINSNLGVGGVDLSWQIVSTGDYNGDGKSDILLRHSSGYVSMWLMNGATISSNLGVGGGDTSWTIIE